MQIKAGKVEGLPFKAAYYIGAAIKPEIVVLHDTAGSLAPGAAEDYLSSKNTPKVSAHFTVARDGIVTQLVPVNRRANHAGVSTWNGRSSCNEFSIGIEIVNPGWMTRISDTMAQTWWGAEMAVNLYNVREVETPQHGRKLWMPYTEAQISAVLKLLECLFRDVASLTDITTHWMISPGRKVDTNPLFPLDDIRTRILGHDDPAAVAAVAASTPETGDRMVQIDLGRSEDTLNLRRWPSFNPNIIGAIPDGAIVPVLRAGTFGGREWLCVLYGGQEGWVVARYAAEITSSKFATVGF